MPFHKKNSPILPAMEENHSPRRKNYLNLIIGLAFLVYGSYRIFSFYTGTEYTNFRLIIAIGFIVLGAADLYRFFKPE